jgi:hypothetical protein
LYNILKEFGILIKLIRLTKMSLIEIYSSVRVGKYLSDMFGRCFNTTVCNFVLEYAIRRVQVIQGGLKINGTHQLLVDAEDVNIQGGNLHTIMKNTDV